MRHVLNKMENTSSHKLKTKIVNKFEIKQLPHGSTANGSVRSYRANKFVSDNDQNTIENARYYRKYQPKDKYQVNCMLIEETEKNTSPSHAGGTKNF